MIIDVGRNKMVATFKKNAYEKTCESNNLDASASRLVDKSSGIEHVSRGTQHAMPKESKKNVAELPKVQHDRECLDIAPFLIL